MPIDKAIASAKVTLQSGESIPAKTMPTAMPSGMLCTVTARTNFAAFVSFSFGKITSTIGRSPTPSNRPTVAGKNDSLPKFSLCSIDGMSSDHTDAATITPAEKPRSGFSSEGFIFCLKNSTHPAPSVVPINGISIPINVIVSPFYTMIFFTFWYKRAVLNERLSVSKKCFRHAVGC